MAFIFIRCFGISLWDLPLDWPHLHHKYPSNGLNGLAQEIDPTRMGGETSALPWEDLRLVYP